MNKNKIYIGKLYLVLFSFSIMLTLIIGTSTSNHKVNAQSTTPDPRFGLDLASQANENDDTGNVFPAFTTTITKFNKTFVNDVSDILASDSTSTWAKFELNGEIKLNLSKQILHTTSPKYRVKSSTQPPWVTNDDISNLGVSNWGAINEWYPVWHEGATKWNGSTTVKTGFAPGTTVFYGWRDVNNICQPPGVKSTFTNYAYDPDYVYDPNIIDQDNINYTYQTLTNFLVLEGAYGDAAPAPEGIYIKPCNAIRSEEETFINFVKNPANSGMTYIIFNEMNLGAKPGQDILLPEHYTHLYKGLYNLIKGHPGCGSVPAAPALDSNAKIIIGTSAQTLDRPGPFRATLGFDDPYDWYRAFADKWIEYAVTSQLCTPKGPFQHIGGKVPTDGIAMYAYTDDVATTQAEVCTLYGKWRDDVITNAKMIYDSSTTGYIGDKFSSQNVILKEFGISQKSPLREYDAVSGTYDNFHVINNELVGDSHLVTNGELASLMIHWLRAEGFSNHNIEWANWLPTYDYLSWKDNGQGTVPLAERRCVVNPTDPFCTPTRQQYNGTQILFTGTGTPSASTASTEVLKAFYSSIRGDAYNGIDGTTYSTYCGSQ